MSTRIMSGYSRTNRVRLPEDKISIDTGKPEGAAAMGAVVRILNRSNHMDDIGNVLTIADAISSEDQSSSAKVKVGVKEYTHLVDANGVSTKTADVNKVAVLLDNGWKVDKIEEVDQMG